MADPERIEKEMAIGRAEFRRLLATLGTVQETSDGFRLEWPEGEVSIRFRPRSPRRLGALTLPVAWIRLELAPLSPEARHAFLDRFRIAFQRGGG